MAARGSTSNRFRRWLLAGIALIILGLGALASWPRASRLFLVSPLPEDQQQALVQRGISVDPPSLTEIPDALLASTGPEVIEAMVHDRGADRSAIHLLDTHVAATSLYPAWDGLAYIATFPKGQSGSYEVLVVNARDGGLVLDLTSVSNPVTP